MSKLKFILPFLLLIAACTGVTNKDKPLKDMKAVLIKNQYQINVPNYLNPSENILNPDASLMYSDKSREFYLMIIDELKTDKPETGERLGLKEYFERSTDNISSGLAEPTNNQPEAINLNGLACMRMTIGGKYNTFTMIYKCYIIESPKFFYQIYCWTISDLLAQNELDMNRTLSSFRELSNSNKKD